MYLNSPIFSVTCLFILQIAFVSAKRRANCRNINDAIAVFHDQTRMSTDLTYILNLNASEERCFYKPTHFNESPYRLHYLGETECRKETGEMTSDRDYDRGVCPWYYDMTYDPNRKPSIMLDAKCRCPGDSRLNNTCFCERMQMAVPVLKRENRKKRWQATVEQVGVSCMCKIPISSR